MNKSAIIVLISLMLSTGMVSAKIPVVQKTRLTDGWSFLRSDVGSVWETVRPVRPGQPEEYPLWTQVTLPHCFNAEDCVDPDVNYYQGPGWYKTLLEVDNPYCNGRVMLEFEGAGQKTDVYVYMTKVGSHTGGYDSWNVDITEAVDNFLGSAAASRFGGKIPLSIRCDNSRDAEMIPSDISDFNIYGGLYRYLNLVYLPPVAVDEIRIKSMLADNMSKAKVTVACSFYNKCDVREADVNVTIIDPDGRIVANRDLIAVPPLGRIELLDFSISSPQLWDVDSPRRYTCRVTVKAEGEKIVSVEHFGIRKAEFIEKGPFYLNGRRLLLRGTHRHEDHAGVAAAMTDSMMVREMRMIKDMGVNFIRLGHYQQSEIILDLCDELGILVWEEIPWCRGGIGGERYRAQARLMLTNMITQHHNHPSVIIWGLGNENDWPNDFPEFEQRDIRGFMSELNTLVHTIDPSRKTAIRRCDFCSDIVDVYSPSIWAGWYRGDYHQYQQFSREGFDRVKHFLHVEWGGDSHPGRHVEDTEPTKNDWSETYIVKLIDWHLKEQENMPWLTGSAFWPFKDFATPVRPENPIPYVNQKGVVQRDLTPKESYYVYQSYWSDVPMVHIIGHSQPVRWGETDEEKEILVYSNCDKVELFVNGVSCGVRMRDSQDFPAAGLRWSVKLSPGENIIKAVAIKGDYHVEDGLTWTFQTEKWGRPARVLISSTPDGDGCELVEISIVDDKGVPCLDSADWVNFDIVGDGELIKNLGTVCGSSKIQSANGRAVIKVKKGIGKSIVAVKIAGLSTEFHTIND